MREYFEACSRVPMLCATLVLVLILVVAVFPALPIGGEMLDVRGGYTYPEALAALEGYGEAGRRTHAWTSVTLDTLLPVVYASFLCGLIYRCRPTERLWRLAYLPLAAGLIDLGENIQIVLMLTRYPNISAGQSGHRLAVDVVQGIHGLDLPGTGNCAGGCCGGPPCSCGNSNPHVVAATGHEGVALSCSGLP